jgi:hypothetical protein
MIFAMMLGGAALLAGCNNHQTSATPATLTEIYIERTGDVTRVPAADLTVTITCSESGASFAGTIVSDGKTQSYSGKTQGTYHVTGHQIECSFKKLAGAGTIKIYVYEGGKELGQAGTPAAQGGVRAEVFRGVNNSHSLFTTF